MSEDTLLLVTTNLAKSLNHQGISLSQLANAGDLYTLEFSNGEWIPTVFDDKSDEINPARFITGGGRIDALKNPGSRDSMRAYCVYESVIKQSIDAQMGREI